MSTHANSLGEHNLEQRRTEEKWKIERRRSLTATPDDKLWIFPLVDNRLHAIVWTFLTWNMVLIDVPEAIASVFRLGEGLGEPAWRCEKTARGVYVNIRLSSNGATKPSGKTRPQALLNSRQRRSKRRREEYLAKKASSSLAKAAGQYGRATCQQHRYRARAHCRSAGWKILPSANDQLQDPIRWSALFFSFRHWKMPHALGRRSLLSRRHDQPNHHHLETPWTGPWPRFRFNQFNTPRTKCHAPHRLTNECHRSLHQQSSIKNRPTCTKIRLLLRTKTSRTSTTNSVIPLDCCPDPGDPKLEMASAWSHA